MKLRIEIIFLTLLHTWSLMVGQSRNLSYYGNNLRDHLLIKQQNMTSRLTNDQIEGSPYFADSFTTAIVHTDKIVYDGIPMRFEIHQGYMEFKDNGNTFILDPKPEIKKIEFNGYQVSVEPFELGGTIKLGYFIVLDSSDIKLLKKKNVRFQEMIPAKALQSKSTPAQYVPMPDEFFYRIPGQAALLITNVKKLVSHFPDHQKSLLSFVSRHKIKSNQEDLKSLWEYYSKLILKDKK